MRSRLSTVIAATALFLGLTACGSDSVTSSDLETVVAEQLETEVGQAPDSVDCPNELPAEVGAEVRCSLTAEETTFGLTVTVTGVEGDDVLFDIVVDDAPEG